MPHVSLKELRDAASSAHRTGNTDAAVELFEQILDLFPETPEAVEAVFYLSSIGKRPRRPAARASVEKKKEPLEGGSET